MLPTSYLHSNHIYIYIYIYICVCVCVCVNKQDLVLNNLQGLICPKHNQTKPNSIKIIIIVYLFNKYLISVY